MLFHQFLKLAIGALVLLPPCGRCLLAGESPDRDPYPWREPKESLTILYHDDPDHLWNRLHEALWVRRGKDGQALGRDRLDPYLWSESTHLLEGEPHRQIIRVLREFNANDGQGLIHDPVKRALLQRDLWTVFDWTVSKKYRHSRRTAERKVDSTVIQITERKLRDGLLVAMRNVALSKDQIEKLPDNFAAAIASRRFPSSFDPHKVDQPFLPPDLFIPNGPWVVLQQGQHRLLTLQHTRRFPRSEFAVLLQLPRGRDATVEYLKELTQYKRDGKMQYRSPISYGFGDDAPQLPVHTQIALARRTLLIDTDGNVRVSPLVESIQFRVFLEITQEPDSQSFHEFTLSRRALFHDVSRGLRPIARDETDVMPSLNPHIYDEIESERPLEHNSRQIMNKCHGCHREAGLHAINSFQNSFALRATSSITSNDFGTRYIAERRYDWGLLKGLWEGLP